MIGKLVAITMLTSLATNVCASEAWDKAYENLKQWNATSAPTVATPKPKATPPGLSPETAIEIHSAADHDRVASGTWFKYADGNVYKKGSPAPVVVTEGDYDAVPMGASYWFHDQLLIKRSTTSPGLAPSREAIIRLQNRISFDQLQTGSRDQDTVKRAPVIATDQDYEAVPVGDFYFLDAQFYLKCRYPSISDKGKYPGDTDASAIRLHSKEDEAKIKPGQWVIDSRNIPVQWTADMVPTPTPESVAPNIPGWIPNTAIILCIVAAIVVTIVVFYNVCRKPKPKPPPPRPEKEHPRIYDDYEQFKLAMQVWDRDRQLFEQNETARLAQLNEEIKKGGPLTGLGCLGFIVAALAVGSAQGAGAGWGIIILGVIIVGAVASAEEQIRRWRFKTELVHRVFSEPEPLYEPRPQDREPPPQYEPPPRREPKDHVGEVTSLRQAFEILGLPPGRITLAEAKAAHRRLMSEYHPDKVAHLGEELRKLAAQKALEINLAMEFIEKNCTHTNTGIVDEVLRLKTAVPFIPFRIKMRRNDRMLVTSDKVFAINSPDHIWLQNKTTIAFCIGSSIPGKSLRQTFVVPATEIEGVIPGVV